MASTAARDQANVLDVTTMDRDTCDIVGYAIKDRATTGQMLAR